MRTFFAMILGALLTFAAVYIHDSLATSTVPDGTKADTSEMIVNWDVANRKWGYVKDAAHAAWLKLQSLDNSSSTKGA